MERKAREEAERLNEEARRKLEAEGQINDGEELARRLIKAHLAEEDAKAYRVDLPINSTFQTLSGGAGRGKPKLPERRKRIIGIAKFAFLAEEPGDLGFKQGDIVTIISETTDVPYWGIGRRNGREGKVPMNRIDIKNTDFLQDRPEFQM